MNIIKDWVGALGLRHQGVIVSAVRGPDGIHRDDPIKTIVRMFRGEVLNAHCGDVSKAASYMIPFDALRLQNCVELVLKSIDHYNVHYFLHFLHAVEIVGYKHSHPVNRATWRCVYERICKKMHIQPEPETALDGRLNLDEESFAANQE